MPHQNDRSSGLFSGIVLITVGVLFLLWTYGGIHLGSVLVHFWPLLLIFWGLVKIFERTWAQRQGRTAGWITPGEVFLVIGLIILSGVFVTYEIVKTRIPPGLMAFGNPFSYDLDVAPKSVPPNAHVEIVTSQGDITVRAADVPELRVTGQKSVRTWNSNEAERMANPISVAITQDGDTYEIRPTGYDMGDTRFGVSMDVVVPKHAFVTARTDHGDVTISDMLTDVSVTNRGGDIDISDTNGNVNVDARKGDIKVSDTKGDVKIANTGSEVGGQIEVINASGSLSINGEFFGPIRAEKIAKGVRFLSQRTDLTLNQLTGHMDTGAGDLDIVDAPGNIALRIRSKDVNIENPTGKVNVENHDASVSVRFASAPRDDVNIANTSGEINLSIPSSASFDIQADCHSCDIDSDFSADSLKKSKTENGDSHMEGKYGSGRGPKIILKTSYGSINIRKTS